TLESTSAEDARAILGSEDTKTWRGDPHERCMNALYKGILYYRRGDLDNASACFKRGLLADAWSESGEHQEDFAALAFLLGWASHRRGKDEQARFSFKEAAERMPANEHFKDPRPDENNVLVVADLGCGPRKYADGPNGSIARFRADPYPEGGLEILVDGAPAGRSAIGADIFVQAITRGDKTIDGIRKGKAVFKTGAAIAGAVVLSEGIEDRDKGKMGVGAGLLLLSVLTNARADVRHWSYLPGEVHVLPLRLPPGQRRLSVRVVDRHGRPLPGWERTFQVTVPNGGDTLYYLRAGGGRAILGLTDPQPKSVSN
ncbi:MAG: hypothetical protein ACREID_07570, partial [Planctomycetota bacterium]